MNELSEIKHESSSLRSLRDKLSGKIESLKGTTQKTKKASKTGKRYVLTRSRKLSECLENFEKEKAHKIQLVEENVEDWGDAYRAQVDMLTAKISSLESSIKPEESFRIMIAELGETINRCQSKRCDTCGGPFGCHLK